MAVPLSLLNLVTRNVGVSLRIHLPVLFKLRGVSNHPWIHVLNPVNDFLMTTVDHWPLLWVTEVATSPLNHVTGCWIMITSLWALEAAGRGLKFTHKATLEALINGSVSSKVTNVIISPVPNCL